MRLMPRQPRHWLKVKCLYREEFVVVGWTDPEGSRPYLGALLLAYYDADGRLVYAGRAGTGIKREELERLWQRLQPLAIAGGAPRRASRSATTRIRCSCRAIASTSSSARPCG
jgi:ATP-dependent DNA ligase